MATVEQVVNIHKDICDKARELIPIKGLQYCGVKQSEGDTLASRRTQFLIGFTDRPEAYSLSRALEKLVRIDSMMKQHIDGEKEKIEDSIHDLINDVIFSYILYNEGLESIL